MRPTSSLHLNRARITQPAGLLLIIGALLCCTGNPSPVEPDIGAGPEARLPSDTIDMPDVGLDIGPEVAPPERLFELGVNETGKNTAEFYSNLGEGDELNIEYGPQGLWMVVLAFRTKGIWNSGEELRITAGCWVGDTNIGELILAKQRLLPGPEGWSYYYNLFVVVDEVGAAGNDARITLEVTSSSLPEPELLERTVRLVGGPP